MNNRLPVLAAEIKNASVVFQQAQKMTADAAFVMGKALLEAKELCQHGEWTDFLKSAGVPARTAQRCMRLVLSGYDVEYVGLVGFTEALREIDEAQEIMPPDGLAMIASWDEEPAPDTMIWWRTGRFCGGFVQAYNHPDKDDTAACLIVQSMPIVYIAFIVDVFANGLMWDRPRRERQRRQIDFDERDRLIDFLRESAARLQEGSGDQPA